MVTMWIVTAQDVHFFYTRSRLSALQSYVLTFSTNFQFFSHLNSAQQHLVIELCRALKIHQKYPRLFNKVTRSFVAIELFTFSKVQNSIFIAQESSQYLG